MSDIVSKFSERHQTTCAWAVGVTEKKVENHMNKAGITKFRLSRQPTDRCIYKKPEVG